ncbi:hypothetical protein, conserved [Babesia ovata]|uniref:6-Cys domain-containing protein n=1 Tax=Babesia ovata TaxID=189622 RepID=A0A2H6KC20_9APIC|nr:uncharacterized protein BOVATA_020280 [Babesia ovata]GBE60535.1 hypothetical protein, conserved [Babesia ovata]
MRSFLSNGGKIVTAHEPNYHWDLQNGRHWVVAKYFSGLALSPFSGECVCIDSETGHVTASIEIRPKTNYVCDISSMLERRRANPINGPWCSVVLHPGSTLTIRFPTADVHSASNDATQLLPTDQFEAEFLPKDLTTLRQLKTTYDVELYEEISYNEALVGDALEMDVSQMAQGEVKLKYHEGKPLALKGGHNSFLYQWGLKSTNEDVPDKLRAIVKLSLALTHHYHIIGSDRGLRSVFGSSVSKQYNPTKTMESGMGNVYGGGYDLIGDNRKASIYCRTDEELLPNDCESTAYDLHANRIVPFPGTVYNVTPYPIRGFQIYDMGIQKSPISYACVCVDQRGKETSRLVLEANNEVQQTYKVRRKETSHRLLPYISLPWRKVALILEGPTSTRFIMLQHTSKKIVKLQVGTTLSMTCAFDPNVQTSASNGLISTTWLPKIPNEFHYTVIHTPHGRELIRRSHKDAIVGTPNALEVSYQGNTTKSAYNQLRITSSRGAVLISKDPAHAHYVPMRFLCGKTSESSGMPIITDDKPTSDISAPFIPNTIESSTRYTWKIVKVAVETTDPYMQGCGVTQVSAELFKPETPQLYDAEGQSQFGCTIDIQAAKEAAFYCPAPYVLDPPNCFSQVYVDGEVKSMSELSKSLMASRSNHFVILRLYSSLIGPEETLHQTPPLECRCVTIKGVVLSTIQIENYYTKW